GYAAMSILSDIHCPPSDVLNKLFIIKTIWNTGSAVDFVFQKGKKFRFGHARLFGGIAVAKRDGAIFFDRIKVDRDAVGGPDFVLTAVAAADGARGIVEHIPAALKFFVKLLGAAYECFLVLEEREDGCLIRRDLGAELQYEAFFRQALVVRDLVF